MSHKKRIFVEKRGIFDVESPKVLNEIKSILPNIQSVKVFNIYDIFGLDEIEFEKVEITDKAIIAFITTSGQMNISIDGLE